MKLRTLERKGTMQIQEQASQFPSHHLTNSSSRKPTLIQQNPSTIFPSDQLEFNKLYPSQQADQFQDYTENIQQMLSKVNKNQLSDLKKKYRYYLTKVDRLEHLKLQLQQKYNNLQETVQSSPLVKDQTISINFIQMISKQTEEKLKVIQDKVHLAKQEKRIYNKQIIQLKQEIRKQKDYFFNLKRVHMQIKNKIVQAEKANRLLSANNTFQNILSNKVSKRKLKLQNTKPSNFRINNSRASCSNICLTQSSVGQTNSQNHNKNNNEIENNIVARYSCLSQIDKNNGNLETWPRYDHSKLFYQSHASFQAKDNKIRQGKNRYIVDQLNKISQMKNQLMRQTLKRKNLITLSDPQQQKGLGQLATISSAYFRLNKVKITGTFPKNQSNQYAENKDCLACSQKIQRRGTQKKKFALQPEEVERIKQKLGHSLQEQKMDAQDNLLLREGDLQHLKTKRQQKQAFIELSPAEIISLIVQKKKIYEVLRFLEREKIYEFKKTLSCLKEKMIR